MLFDLDRDRKFLTYTQACLIPHAEDIAIFDVDPELSWVLIVEKEVSTNDCNDVVPYRLVYLNVGGIPNVVWLGIHKAA